MKLGSKTHGLGDTLLLSSICKFFPGEITIQLPPQNKRFECLFQGLADTEIVGEDKIICAEDYGTGHYSRRKLRAFFQRDAEFLDVRPLILYSDPESEEWVHNYLLDKPNPVIICPFVSRQWSEVRDMPFDIIQEAIKMAKILGETPIFVQENDQDFGYAKLINLDLKKLICLIRRCGKVYTANTGIYHVAVATGCSVICFQPEDSHLFVAEEWCYQNPTIKHFTWSLTAPIHQSNTTHG